MGDNQIAVDELCKALQTLRSLRTTLVVNEVRNPSPPQLQLKRGSVYEHLEIENITHSDGLAEVVKKLKGIVSWQSAKISQLESEASIAKRQQLALRKTVSVQAKQIIQLQATGGTHTEEFHLSRMMGASEPGHRQIRSKRVQSLLDAEKTLKGALNSAPLAERERALTASCLNVYRQELKDSLANVKVTGVDPEVLQSEIASECFDYLRRELGEDAAEDLGSFDDFYDFFMKPPKPILDSSAEAQEGWQPPLAAPTYSSTWLSSLELTAYKRLSGLGYLGTSDVLEVFACLQSAKGGDPKHVDRNAFEKCMQTVAARIFASSEVSALTHEEQAQAKVVRSKLFDIFDSNGDGTLDHRELLAGLSVLCGGSGEEKAHFAFELFDADKDGTLSMAEMKQYMCSVLRINHCIRDDSCDGSIADKMSPEEIADATVTPLFEELDMDGNGALSMSEFKNFLGVDNKKAS